jgi:hypothetical protein
MLAKAFHWTLYSDFYPGGSAPRLHILASSSKLCVRFNIILILHLRYGKWSLHLRFTEQELVRILSRYVFFMLVTFHMSLFKPICNSDIKRRVYQRLSQRFPAFYSLQPPPPPPLRRFTNFTPPFTRINSIKQIWYELQLMNNILFNVNIHLSEI